MPRNWESTFNFWANALSPTEQEKCDNAERAVRKAIEADSTLADKNISIFAQGSYRNRTNVRQDSDVDICVCCHETVFVNDLPQNAASLDELKLSPLSYGFSDYKNDVERALTSHFGRDSVKRGNKAFDIHRNTYRVNADVVPTFEYRRYTVKDLAGNWKFDKGTAFLCDDGKQVVNWPEQNYQNGVYKNTQTGRRYKAVARILKNLRNEMHTAGRASAGPMASFLLECLAYNVPNTYLMPADMTDAVKLTLQHIYANTTERAMCEEWTEVNEIKYLFHSTQGWSYRDVNQFAFDAWNYIGLWG